ncbi:hypothetical protein Sjap_011317 [Stephania japonica]|uniref:R13L1/DRL21-like LRR repeat region domain-containing protein n=1 Tax=Stephania japonica TaxID=461633 RepID=A0AAP0JD61_9MAGN
MPAEFFSGMKNLQILDLSNNGKLNTLPDSLGNLIELATLKLNNCVHLITLPQSTSKLCSLRQLENEGCRGLRGMPSGIGQGLSRLEKLSMWPLLCGSGGSENNIEELRGLRLLRGSLHIRTTGVAHHIDDVEKEPPSNIEELVIGRYGGRRFPEWMEKMRSFPRLRRIKFAFMWNVEEWGLNWRHKEKEGEECFPSLQHLKIRTCWNLKALPQELGNLTSLETLSIRQCYELVSVPQLQLHLMTSLKKLVISVCPKLKFVFHGLRHLTSLQYLSIRDCPGVEIPKGELDQLVALRGSSFLYYIDKELIRDQDPTIPETSGKQVLD